MMTGDKMRFIEICAMLDANNKRLARIKNGENDVPDFNRPQKREKQEDGHT